MALNTDFHNHVVRSSAEQMIQSAHRRGLRMIGLSEHVFQMNEIRDPLKHMPLEGSMLNLPDYIQSVQEAARTAQIDVRLGLEVDFVPEINHLIQQPLRGYGWDFLIGSVHEIDGYQFEPDQALTPATGEALWLRYLELLCAAVQSGYFQVISHPVRMRISNPHLPASLQDEYGRLAELATRCNVALEINGYDVLHYPNMVRFLAKICAEQHTPISVGSDAHDPTQIMRAHPQIETILCDAGLTRVRVWSARAPEEYMI